MPARWSAWIEELRRRRVFRVIGWYGGVAFVVLQIADIVFPALNLPPWALRATLTAALAGFPIAVALAWAYQILPEEAGGPEGGPSSGEPHAGATAPVRPPYIVVSALGAGLAVLFFLAATEYLPRNAADRAAGGVQPVTVAILPFTGGSMAEADQLLELGMPDAIASQLSSLEGLRVRPTAAVLSAISAAGEPLDLGRLGAALDVTYIGTGTYFIEGDLVRMSVQLARVSDGATAWTAQYTLPRSNLLALQDSIATRVAESLSVAWSAAERQRLYRRYASNAVAYDAYLAGRAHLVRRTEEDTRAAVVAFNRALARDPDYALARAGLAMAAAEIYLRYPLDAEDGRAWQELAFEEAHRALGLDPGLAEAHEAMAAMYRKSEFDWDRTIDSAARALELNTGLEMPHYYIAGALYHLGVLEVAARVAERGHRLNPGGDRVEALRTRGMTAFLAGRFAEATTLLEQAHRRSDRSVADWNLALAYYYAGDRARGEALLEDVAARGSSSAAARARASLGSILAARGDVARARALAQETSTPGAQMDHHIAYGLGTAYAQLGEPAEAVRWLRAAAETGFPCYPWYARDPLLDPIREHPEFHGFIEQLRRQHQATSRRYAAL